MAETDRLPSVDEDTGRPLGQLIDVWFNPAAFALPAIGNDGSAGRSNVDGPGYRNVDLGVFRDIRFAGHSALQIRAEVTNVLNTINLQNQGLNLNAPATFGKIRTARDIRRVQLGARMSF